MLHPHGAHLSEAARLAEHASRLLIASMLCLEAAEVEMAPAAEAELAELLEDAGAYASELHRVASGKNAPEPRAVVDDHVVRDDPLEVLDLPEIPFATDASYRAMWDRVAAAWRERNRFRQLRDVGRSRSSIVTEADLQQHLEYLDGFPEAQRAAIDAFQERQIERDTEMARRTHLEGQAKRAAHTFMKERQEFLKTLPRKGKRR